jgi:hypothetical protein
MEISLRIDCTPTEARQMLGSPDLLPLYECLALAREDWLVCLIATLDLQPLRPGADDQRERRTAV